MTGKNISLAGCRPLDAGMEQALNDICRIRKVEEDASRRIRDTARFLNEVFRSQEKAMADPPCGSGKSFWADAHTLDCARQWDNPLRTISSDPPPPKPIYLVVDTLKSGQERVDALIGVGVPQKDIGFYHSFWEEEHNRLTGESVHYEEFAEDSGARNQCMSCPSKAQCRFGNRNSELRKAVVVMTHEGFIRLHEKRLIPPDRDIIIDEEPSLYFQSFIRKGQLHFFLRHLNKLQVTSAAIQRIREIAEELLAVIDDPTMHHGTLQWHSTVPHATKVEAIQELEELERLKDQGNQSGNVGESYAPTVLEDMADAFRLPYSLSLIFTLGYALLEGAKVFIYCDGKDIAIARDRIGFEIPNKVILLNASAHVSRYVYPEGMAIWTCEDLRGNYQNVTLHCLCGSLTKKYLSREDHLQAMAEYAKTKLGSNDPVFLAVNKEKHSGTGSESPRDGDDDRAADDASRCPKKVIISEIPTIVEKDIGYRGSIRGSNRWQDVSKGIIATSVFTDVAQYALNASLRTGREYSRDELFQIIDPDTQKRIPRFTRQRNIQQPEISEECLRQAADEIYQTIMRLSCRRDRATPVDVVLFVPNIDLLMYIYALMPHVRIKSDNPSLAIADDLLNLSAPLANDALFEKLGLDKTSGKNIAKVERLAARVGLHKQNAPEMPGNHVEWVKDTRDKPGSMGRGAEDAKP